MFQWSTQSNMAEIKNKTSTTDKVTPITRINEMGYLGLGNFSVLLDINPESLMKYMPILEWIDATYYIIKPKFK